MAGLLTRSTTALAQTEAPIAVVQLEELALTIAGLDSAAALLTHYSRHLSILRSAPREFEVAGH